MTTLTGLAARCRAATGANRPLDGEIFKAIRHREGDDWSDDFEDEVWHRRDRDDSIAFEGPPAYTGSLDAANGARIPELRLASLREHLRTDGAGPDWKPCGCTIEHTPREVGGVGRVFTGAGATLELAMMDAVLQALAHLAGEA